MPFVELTAEIAGEHSQAQDRRQHLAVKSRTEGRDRLCIVGYTVGWEELKVP
jgi:hypothetical protein